MTPDHIKSIQDSFAKVGPIADAAAAMFYNRLFEIAPDVKPLFRGDMIEQGRKLMKTLTLVVNGLGNLDSVLPAASALAKSHVAYGVRPTHYGPVGEALLWTLEHGLGSDWTPELKKRMEHRLRDARELHDRRSLRPRRGRRITVGGSEAVGWTEASWSPQLQLISVPGWPQSGRATVFSKGRDFAACTGDHTVLAKTSKRGNRYLRTLFVQAVLVKIKPSRGTATGLSIGSKPPREAAASQRAGDRAC